MSQEKKVIGVVLTEKTVVSFLLRVSLDSVKLLTQAKPLLFSAKNLIDKVDESLQDLGPESEDVNEVVFVFDHHWHDGTDVFADRQKEIDRLLEELSLTDLGFVTLEEVVAEVLVQQRPNLSALVSIVSKTDISVSVFRENKQICNEIVGRSNDFRSDMIEAAARLVKTCGQDQRLPHKFILVSMELSPLEMERLHQLLLETDWQAHGFFLQLPAVEIVSRETFLAQVADQVGKVIQHLLIGSELATQPTEVKETSSAPVVSQTTTAELNQADQANQAQPQLATTRPTDADQSNKAAAKPVITGVATTSSAEIAAESAVVASDQPVSQQQPDTGSALSSSSFTESHGSATAELKRPAADVNLKSTASQKRLLGRVKGWFSHHWHSMDDRPKKPFVLAGIILGIIAWVVMAWLMVTSRFQLTVLVAPATKSLTKELTVTLDKAATVPDASVATLPAKPATKVVEVSDTTQATGEKNVGDKAKGKVKLINKTTEEKTLSEGTQLISDDGKDLKFELLSTVTIPAATISDTGEQETKTYGTKEVTVRATEPGEEANLPADTQFKLDGISTKEISAVSVADFQGGTTKTATVVTEADLNRLKKGLLEDARTEAEKQFNAQSDGQLLFSPPTALKVIDETASHQVGEETDEVKLTLKVEVAALSFSKADLNQLVKQEFKKELADDMELIDDSIEVLTKFATEKDQQSQTPTLIVSATAKARYKLDSNTIAKEIAGRYLNEAESVLAKDEKIDHFEFSFQPSLVSRLVKRVPGDPTKFTVKISQ